MASSVNKLMTLRGMITRCTSIYRGLASTRNLSQMDLPSNLQELNESDKTSVSFDRSREVSGQQTTQLFSGTFMSGQSVDWEVNGSNNGMDVDTRGFQVDRTANLESVIQSNLPEPYRANDDVYNVKDQLPRGDHENMLQDRGRRLTMEDRLNSIT